VKSVQSEQLRALLAVDRPQTAEEWHAHNFLFNVAEARENGFDLVCPECGCSPEVAGFDEDDPERWHEDWCQLEAKNAVAEAEFAERVKRIMDKGNE
jgi:hypothetical protein